MMSDDVTIYILILGLCDIWKFSFYSVAEVIQADVVHDGLAVKNYPE